MPANPVIADLHAPSLTGILQATERRLAWVHGRYQVADQFRPLLQEIGERLAGCRARRYIVDGTQGPGMELLQYWRNIMTRIMCVIDVSSSPIKRSRC